MKKADWFEILFWIVIIALFIMILTRIFGNSATDVQIYLTIVLGMLSIMTYLIKSNNKLMKINREVGEIKVQMRNSFIKVKREIQEVKEAVKLRRREQND